MITRNSRHNHAAIITVLDSTGQQLELDHLDIRPRLQTTIAADNYEFSPNRSDNWSRIAWQRLGDGRHYWVICDHSGIVNPHLDLLPKQRLQYVSRLAADVSTGDVTSITVTRPKKMHRGLVYRVEDLNPANLTSFDVAVLSVDDDTGVVDVTPVTVGTAVPAALSRISLVRSESVRLTVPSLRRVLFDAYDFGNPLITLVE